ncbi:MAG: SDR family oxidoreductase [Atopobiaceae bacterium]|nr:SDR family oxidoreductase [Atopobiaceae bacterium]
MSLRCIAVPSELCPQMLLLASEENTYCTGQTIYVDGGLTSQL